MAKLNKNLDAAKHKVAPGVQKSLYPLEYNKNNPMEGLNDWNQYIRAELTKANHSPVIVVLIGFNSEHCASVLAERAKNMDNLVTTANQIINNKK
ncbi:hypothetical protein [Sphingobacterium multivorum]|uniref:hypothetical protein n=1 Tax=Sphingobacterium multivorum TaxID=28454 RepID=UPI0031BBB510